jgi:hypothetical protein
MGLSNLILWVCSLFGASCGVAPAPAPAPNVAIIQSAYEREAASGSPLHDKGLKVLEAGCDPPKDGRFLCQITFMSKDDPSQRLYYDVVAVARGSGDWELKSGLCKR